MRLEPEPAQLLRASFELSERASQDAMPCERDERPAECRASPSTKSSRPGCCPEALPATKASKGFEMNQPRSPAATIQRRRRRSQIRSRHENPSTHFASAPSSSLPPELLPSQRATAPRQTSRRCQRTVGGNEAIFCRRPSLEPLAVPVNGAERARSRHGTWCSRPIGIGRRRREVQPDCRREFRGYREVTPKSNR